MSILAPCSTTLRRSSHDLYKSGFSGIVIVAILLLCTAVSYGQAPDFTVAASPASIRVPQLAKGSTIVHTTIAAGFKSSIELSATGLPAGSSATFSRSSIPSPGIGTSALTVSVGGNTPLGVYVVTVTASSGTTIHQAAFSLNVTPSQTLPTGFGWHQLANTSMESVCLGNVSNGMYSDPTMTTTTNYDFDCNQVVPWSGGVMDDNHQRLIVWGGGHVDYAGNEISALNLSGTPSWQVVNSPTIPIPFTGDGNNWEGLQPYFVRAADGGQYQPGASPSSRHTYNGVQYVPYQNKVYSFGGSLANVGFLSQETWTLDMGTMGWTLLGPPYSLAPGMPTSAYNPNTGHIVMHDKNWSLLDFSPANGTWTTLTTQYHVDDGTTAIVDPVNNLFVVVGAAGTTDNLGYPNVPTTRTIQIFPLTAPYAMQTWSDPSCDLIYRNSGLAWDSALGLVVGYPGGGNQVYFLNTGAQDVVTPFGTVPSHKCLDVPISLNPSPVKGVDYPQDPEGTGSDANIGIFGRFGYFPSLDTFALVNNRTKNAWTLQVTGGSPAPSFAVSVAPSLTVAEGSQGTLVVTTTVANGFNNSIALSAAGAPAGTTVTFAPSQIGAPGAGSSTMTVNVGASTPTGTYPIVVSAFGGGDTQNPIVTLTVTASGQANFALSASPAAITIPQSNQGTSTITSTISGGFNAAISLSAAGAPPGTTVSFSPQTIPAPGSGSAAMNITVGANTPAGTYPITVTGNGGGVQQNTTVTLTVTPAQGFSLSASPASLSIQQGNQGTSTITSTIGGGFSAAISLSVAGAPAGTTVSLNPQTIPAPGSGNSTIAFTVGSNTAAGTYPVTVTGNGGGLQRTATITLTVTTPQPSFTLTASPASLTIQQGNQGTSTVTSTVSGGFSHPITLTASGAPSGTTVSFNPVTIPAPGSGNSTMTVIVGSSTPTGTYPITVTGTGGGIQQFTTVTLTVSAQQGQPNFSLSASPAAITVQQGNQGASTITTTSSGGFNSAISLSASGAPFGTTVSFNPQTIPAPGSGNSTMTITVGSNAPLGTYPITVTGNGGGLQRTATVTLTVIATPSFTLSASPASLTVQQGNQGASTITSTLIGGFNSAISLSAAGMPTGTTVSFNPQTIPAPGSGSSAMTITVGLSTAAGTYPITVTGSGGGVQQNTTVTLTVTGAGGGWSQGFDFRNTASYVTDPPGDTYVLPATAYPTRGNGVTYGWVRPSMVQGRDRNAGLDPRLAGINLITNGLPATFNVDLPSAGSYNLSLAMGDAGYEECWVKCQIQFLDGNTVLATVTKGTTNQNYFYDAKGNNWSAASWPASNLSQQVTLTGTRLTVVVGTSQSTGDSTPIAFLGVVQVSGGSPNYALSASPASLTIQQGNQGSSTITSTLSGGFNGAISLSASGAPAGTTVSFNPQTIPSPGSGNSAMTITVGSSTPTGTYPITVTGNGGGLQRTITVTLTVTAQQQANFALSASPAAVTVQQGNQGGSTITSTLSGGFNSAVSLSAAGMPTGTTVSFNPQTLPAPGSGNSAMTITVGSNTPLGTYPITVTGNGGGLQRSTTVTLTVIMDPNFTLSASPASLTVQQGNQGNSTITSTVIGTFNSAISLSAAGMPSGTTVSFNPNPIPAPGSGNSPMTITVGSSTAAGTYPITITGNGGGVQQNTTVTLTVTGAGGGWSQGFDFRNTASYVTDPPGDLGVLATTAYPTRGSNVTYGWVRTSLVQGRDRNAHQDARLAGINLITNGSPATFNVDLPSAGSYNLSLAMGDAGYEECWVQCQIQFLDGSTVLATLTKGTTNLNYFYDTKGNNWSAAAWPASNLSQQVTLTGTRLTVVVGTSQSTGDSTPIAFLGVAQVSGGSPNYALSASPASLTIQQGNQGSSTITSTLSGGFNGAISLSASGAPSGTTVSFNPQTMPAPGSGNSAMTITVGSSTPTGTYPITVTGNGGGLQRTTTVTLTVTALQQANFALLASPAAIAVQQGNQGNSTITSTLSGGFNSAISLSAAGIPAGTTVSFNPQTIPAPGSGNSAMTITVGSNTVPGTYPITVTGSGGGLQRSTILTLTVTGQPGFTLTAAPVSLSIQQGNQGASTMTTTISGGFNGAIGLSAAGVPAGTTISFNPQMIPAPGSGNSTMTITVGSSTATGIYPITVTGNGGGVQQNTTVTLTVTSVGGGGGNGIIVYSTSGSDQSNRMISIGRVFKPGDIPNFAQAVVAGTPILTQCDVKNRWQDGSLKFGIVSFIVPTVSIGGTQVTFQNQATGNNNNYLAQSDMLNPQYDFDGQMQLTGAASPTISARSILEAGNFTYWLQGPIVTAVILEDRANRSFDVNTDNSGGNPLHPIFEAWFYPQTNQVEVGFTLENSWASSTAANSARNQTYGLTLTTGFNSPATQLTQPPFTQDIFTRWRRSFWVDSAPPPIQINYNWTYLASTTAYANFNANYTPNESDLEAMYAVYTNQPAGRLTIPGIDNLYGGGGIVNYDEYLNGAGYNPWIGPYSQWDVDYLMTGDSRMQKMMTDNADLAGRFPIFFREADHNAGTGHYFDAPGNGSVDPYGHVVSINARQYATLNLANQWNVSCDNDGPDMIATSLPGDGSGWYGVPGDTSHLPDFAYVPYTLTGKYFYMENEMLEAGFAAGHGTGCYAATFPYDRQGHYGLLYSTTRELAWAMRTMAYAAFIAPDGTPEGAYFTSKIGNNIAMIEGEHAMPQTISGADPTWSYNWGKNYFQYSQAADPSTLYLWRMGDCQDGTSTCYVANGQGANNNINANIVQSAESGFMSSFVDIVLGLTHQLGVVDTTPILQRNARRYLNILLNPTINHYLIEQYVYPTTLVGTICQNPANPGCVWISDWNTFQTGYLTLPTAWSTREVDYGAEAASALSFMTNYTVDGYNGQDAWNFYSTSDATQLGIVYHNEPQWSIAPLQ